MVQLNNDWDEILKDEFQKEYYQKLRQFLAHEYRTRVVYPDMYDIFNALRYTSFADTKVVILGQDPYHGPNQAHGLCFSVKRGIEPPPSLQNIYKELSDDVGFDLFSRTVASEVFSALQSLTSVFGMGTGGPSAL